MALNFLVIHQVIVPPESLQHVLDAWERLNKAYADHLLSVYFSQGQHGALCVVSVWKSEDSWNQMRQTIAPELQPFIEQIQTHTLQQLLLHTGPVLGPKRK